MNSEAQQSFFYDIQIRFSSETIRGYKISLKQFFVFCEKNYDVVKPTDVQAWIAHMEEKGLKTKTIYLKLAALKSFYLYCVEENTVTNNPTLITYSIKRDDLLPHYLTQSEVKRLLELEKNEVKEQAIVETLYSTGLRLRELLNIKLVDVNWEKRQISIRQGKRDRNRFVYFTNGMAERLKAYLELRQEDSEYLFSNQRGEMLSRNFVENRFKAYSKALEFRVTPHSMRHTFAARLAQKNAPQIFIQELLGLVTYNRNRIYNRQEEELYLEV